MFVRNCKAIVNNYFGFLVKEFSGILRALLPPGGGGYSQARPARVCFSGFLSQTGNRIYHFLSYSGYRFTNFCLKQDAFSWTIKLWRAVADKNTCVNLYRTCALQGLLVAPHLQLVFCK